MFKIHDLDVFKLLFLFGTVRLNISSFSLIILFLLLLSSVVFIFKFSTCSIILGCLYDILLLLSNVFVLLYGFIILL